MVKKHLWRDCHEKPPTTKRYSVFGHYFFLANCNIKLSISSVRVSLVTARCGLGEEGAVGDRRGQAGRAGQAA